MAVKKIQGDKKIDVFFDGGVRRGTDVMKAVALGADAVFLGRPQVWGLAVGGQKGVEKVFEILNMELYRAMILSGCLSVKDIKSKGVIYKNKLAKM